MNTFWQKKLSDGSIETGNQDQIREHLVSWTKGRQDILSVNLFFAGKNIEIECVHASLLSNGWKQLDNYLFNASTSQSILTSREVWCDVSKCRYVNIERTVKGEKISFGDTGNFKVPYGSKWAIFRILSNGTILCRYIRDGEPLATIYS